LGPPAGGLGVFRVQYLRMEWLWVALLGVVMVGPVVLLLIRRGRGEKLSQAPDSLMESYRGRFENGPRWPKG
jgi:hypothetical protein